MKKIFVLAAAAVFVLGMSAPSWAVADFAIGGSVRIDAGWRFTDLGDVNEPGGEDSQTNFFLVNPGNGRINFKATVGDVMGFFEFGMGSTGVSTRHIYASWDMGGGSSLLFGHTWSIMAFGFTDMRMADDLANLGYGCLYFGRLPQIRYTYTAEAWNLKLALENFTVSSATVIGLGAEELNWVVDQDTGLLVQENVFTTPDYLSQTYIPALVAAVGITASETWPLTVSGYYQQFDLQGIEPGTKDVGASVYAAAIDGRVNLEFMKIIYEGWWGNNLGLRADVFDVRPSAKTSVFGNPGVTAAGDDLNDAASYGGFLQLSFPFETVALNIGGGIQTASVESKPSAALGTEDVVYEDDLTTYGFFVNVLYNLTDNFYIQPEITYLNHGDDQDKNAFGTGKNSLGSDIYAGVHLQADF